MPDKVTYIAGWLAVLSLVWGFFTFFYTSDNSGVVADLAKQNEELVDEKSELLQQLFEIKSECEYLRNASCKEIIENETGHSYAKVIEIVEEARQKSVDLVTLGNASFFLGDYKSATGWFTKAADKGNAVAQYNLGLCYNGRSPKCRFL